MLTTRALGELVGHRNAEGPGKADALGHGSLHVHEDTNTYGLYGLLLSVT